MAAWRDRRYDYDGSVNLIYYGKATKMWALTGDKSWYIWKYTYSSSNLVRFQGPLLGVWDNRAELDW